MKMNNQFASPFSAWSGHRLFHVAAGTLIGAMVGDASLSDVANARASSGWFSCLRRQSTIKAAAPMRKPSIKITASPLVSMPMAKKFGTCHANTRLQSGNVLEYQGYFTNTNTDRVRKMTVTMSIPEQVELLLRPYRLISIW